MDKVAANNYWLTPPEELDLVRRYAPVGLDPCTGPDNPTDAKHYYTEEDDGLAQDWDGYGLVFVNPPYSLTDVEKEEARRLGVPITPPIRLWAAKIAEQAMEGVTIIALLPCGARFSTGYWQDNILIPELQAMCFVRGRIKFIDAATGQRGRGPNYDSLYYGFNVDRRLFCDVFRDHGAVFGVISGEILG